MYSSELHIVMPDVNNNAKNIQAYIEKKRNANWINFCSLNLVFRPNIF